MLLQGLLILSSAVAAFAGQSFFSPGGTEYNGVLCWLLIKHDLESSAAQRDITFQGWQVPVNDLLLWPDARSWRSVLK